jgi:hypothetical protein
LEVVFKQKKRYPVETCDYLKRLGTLHPAKVEWYLEEWPLAAFFSQRSTHQYTESIRHSFSNQAYRKEVLHRGTTHDAVGFVDLGILFAADLSGPPKNCDGPLHFLGIEVGAYAVAKTHVLWELLKQTPSRSSQRQDHLRRIMQVWYSATWGKGTAGAVKAALSALCSSKKSFHPNVRELLDHWAGVSSFPLKSARTEVAATTTSSLSSVGHLLKKRTRQRLLTENALSIYNYIVYRQSVPDNSLKRKP